MSEHIEHEKGQDTISFNMFQHTIHNEQTYDTLKRGRIQNDSFLISLL